jgi:hypothetical protein
MYVQDGLSALFQELQIAKSLVLVEGEKDVRIAAAHERTQVVPHLEVTHHGTAALSHAVHLAAEHVHAPA